MQNHNLELSTLITKNDGIRKLVDYPPLLCQSVILFHCNCDDTENQTTQKLSPSVQISLQTVFLFMADGVHHKQYSWYFLFMF